MRLLSNGWTDFHQIFIKRRLCGVIRSPYLHENRSPTVFLWALKTSIFWSENSDCAVFGRLLRANEEEFWEN